MDRAFSSGALGTPPSAPGSPSIGYATSGNPGTGTPPTKPGAYWYHMMTEEIRGVLTMAGLTPSQSDLTQLAQAIKSLQGNFQSLVSITGATTLTNASAGKTILLSGAGSYTVTLPLASACPAGTALVFAASAGSITVSRQGSDLIYPNSSGTTGVVLNNGDNLTLVSSGSAWFAVAGSAVLGNALQSFGNSLAGSGYQKLPTGLIIQWGSGVSNATIGSSVSVSFPIAFPSAVYSVVANPLFGGNTSCNTSSSTTSAFPVFATASSINFLWIAIGK